MLAVQIAFVIKHTSQRLSPPLLHPSALLNAIHLRAWQPHTTLLCAPNVHRFLSLAQAFGTVQGDTIVFTNAPELGPVLVC